MKAAEVQELLMRALVPADTAGQKRTKRAQGLGGNVYATKERQQQGGVWCPVCHHYHRVGSGGCSAGNIKSPSLEVRPIATGRRVNADRG